MTTIADKVDYGYTFSAKANI